MEILERLRNRSESTKRRYALLVAVFATAIIGIGWSTTLPARYSSVSIDLKRASDTDSGSVDELFSGVGSQLGSVGESVTEAGAETSEKVPEDTHLDALSNPPQSVTEEYVAPTIVPAGTAPGPVILPAATTTDTPVAEAPTAATPKNIILQPTVSAP